jgi:transcriptional regulator with XRE-family HTH domain
MKDVPSIRNRLLRLMHERNLSDGALAALTGLSRARINRLKNHRARLTVRDALLIARALTAPLTETFLVETDTAPGTDAPDASR